GGRDGQREVDGSGPVDDGVVQQRDRAGDHPAAGREGQRGVHRAVVNVGDGRAAGHTLADDGRARRGGPGAKDRDGHRGGPLGGAIGRGAEGQRRLVVEDRERGDAVGPERRLGATQGDRDGFVALGGRVI